MLSKHRTRYRENYRRLSRNQTISTIKEIRNEVEEALKKTNTVIKKKWDAKKKLEVEQKNGDLV